MSKGISFAGTRPEPTSMIGSGPNKACRMRTRPSGTKSITPRCSRRSSALPGLFGACSLRWRGWPALTLPSSFLVRRVRARSSSPGRFTRTPSSRDLKSGVAQGKFREDLYYRLNVFPIEVPALRDRADDIPLLVEYLVQRFALKAGKKIRRIEERTLELLRAYDWPGNVRELQNVIERSVILSDGEAFSVDEAWLRRNADGAFESTVSAPGAGAAHEREGIEAALAASQGRVSGPAGAAIRLGIPRQTLESRIRALRINKHRFKTI